MKNIFLLITLLFSLQVFAQKLIKENTFTGTQGSTEWTPETRANLIYYNNGDSVEASVQLYQSGTWINSHRYYKLYDANSFEIKHLESSWNGANNTTGEYIAQTYTEVVRKLLPSGEAYTDKTTQYRWYADDMEWDTTQHIYAVLALDPQSQISKRYDVLQFKFRGSPLENIRRLSYGKDNLARLGGETVQIWVDNEWENSTTKNIRYIGNSNDIASTITRAYTDGGNPTVSLSSSEYSYTASGQIDTIHYFDWDANTSSFRGSFREVNAYNSGSNLESKTIQIYDVLSDSWYNFYQTTYEYAPTGSVSQTNKNNHLKMYPNPVSNQLITETQTPHSVSIYTPTGKLVYQNNATAIRTITMLNEMSPGIYYVQLKLENGTTLSRKIIRE